MANLAPSPCRWQAVAVVIQAYANRGLTSCRQTRPQPQHIYQQRVWESNAPKVIMLEGCLLA